MSIFYIEYHPVNRFVIFDIDGTFTWSDLLGHILQCFNIYYIH